MKGLILVLLFSTLLIGGMWFFGRGRAVIGPLVSNSSTFLDAVVFDGERFIGPRTVYVSNGRIREVAPAGELPGSGHVITGAGRVLMPGFIDCHVHIALFGARAVLRNGVTTARDLGWSLDVLRSVIEMEERPDLVYAGQILTAPGGYPARAGWAAPGTAREIDGEADARAGVAEMVAAGARVIKVAQEPRQGPTLSVDLLRVICEEAHRADLRVTSHCGSLEQLRIALDAGVDELAHGLWSDEWIPDEDLARMVTAGIVVVPTLHIDPSEARVANVRRFLEAGGAVVYGTDMGNRPVPGGIDPGEIELMMAAGMSLEHALASATARAAEHLGLHDRGRIAEGMRADLVLLDGDPREDLDVLAKPFFVTRAGWPVP